VVINGIKQSITQLWHRHPTLFTVTAVPGDGTASRRISTILVPVPTPGYTAIPRTQGVLERTDTPSLSFDDVRVPQENLLRCNAGRVYANSCAS